MAKIDWDFARTADWWTLEQFCEFVCPDDPSTRAKLDRLARLAIRAGTLVRKEFVSGRPRFHPGIYGEPPPRRPDIFYLAPAEALAWARSKGFTIPPELAGIESPPAAGAPLHGSERDSLLKMVLGMAMSAYDYNPGSEKNRATGELKGSISADLNQRGLALDADTVRKFIKEAETRFKHLLRNPQKP